MSEYRLYQSKGIAQENCSRGFGTTLYAVIRVNDARKATNEAPDASSWQVLKVFQEQNAQPRIGGDPYCNLDDNNTPIFCWVDHTPDPALVKVAIGENLSNELIPPDQPQPRDRPIVAMNSSFAWVFWARPEAQVLKRYDRTAGTWTDIGVPTAGQPYTDIAASEQFLWLAGKEGTVGVTPPRLARLNLNTVTWDVFEVADHGVHGTVMLARGPASGAGFILYMTYIMKDQTLHVHRSFDNGATWPEVFTHSLTPLNNLQYWLERAVLMAVAAKSGDAVVTWVDKFPDSDQWRVLAVKESTGWMPVQMNVQDISLVDPTLRRPFPLRNTFGDYMVPAYTDTKVTVIAGRRPSDPALDPTIPDVYVLQV